VYSRPALLDLVGRWHPVCAKYGVGANDEVAAHLFRITLHRMEATPAWSNLKLRFSPAARFPGLCPDLFATVLDAGPENVVGNLSLFGIHSGACLYDHNVGRTEGPSG